MNKHIPPIFLTPKTSMLAGGFYLLTFISIPTLSLYAPLREANFLQNVGSTNGIVLGTVLEIVMALACIATAVVFYPVLKNKTRCWHWDLWRQES